MHTLTGSVPSNNYARNQAPLLSINPIVSTVSTYRRDRSTMEVRWVVSLSNLTVQREQSKKSRILPTIKTFSLIFLAINVTITKQQLPPKGVVLSARILTLVRLLDPNGSRLLGSVLWTIISQCCRKIIIFLFMLLSSDNLLFCLHWTD